MSASDPISPSDLRAQDAAIEQARADEPVPPGDLADDLRRWVSS